MRTESQANGSEREDPDLPERWSTKRKTEVVLRLLGHRRHAVLHGAGGLVLVFRGDRPLQR
jgi:hypothetical protein